MSLERKPNIFKYDNYRKYLTHWFDWMKKKDPTFSHRQFCKQTGFKSANHLLLIMQGKRNISLKTLDKFIEVLELNDRETKFFESLIRFNHSKNMAGKARYLKELSLFWRKKAKHLKKEQYQYLSNWYYAAIRELVCLADFKEDENWIAKKLHNLITPAQAKKAIDTLLVLNLLTRTEEGKLIQNESFLTTGEETNAVGAYLYHEQMTQLAINTLKNISWERRNFSGLTFTIRPKDYADLVMKLNEFRKDICSFLENRSEKSSDQELYQFNFPLFPIGMP
jgi:uncharacterized protein (TIGR02147 family)